MHLSKSSYVVYRKDSCNDSICVMKIFLAKIIFGAVYGTAIGLIVYPIPSRLPSSKKALLICCGVVLLIGAYALQCYLSRRANQSRRSLLDHPE
jgi:hypothetical protein